MIVAFNVAMLAGCNRQDDKASGMSKTDSSMLELATDIVETDRKLKEYDRILDSLQAVITADSLTQLDKQRFVAVNWMDAGLQWEQIHKNPKKYIDSYISWDVYVYESKDDHLLCFLDELNGSYGLILAGDMKTWRDGIIDDDLPKVQDQDRIWFEGRLIGTSQTKSDLPVIAVTSAKVIKRR